MKRLLISASIVGVSLLRSDAAAEETCRVIVPARVEVSGERLSLADLLGPSACPAVARAAARLSLGRTPLAGSFRVLRGEDVRLLLNKTGVGPEEGMGGSAKVEIPQRITVRRSGMRLSCNEIGERILTDRRDAPSTPGATPRVAAKSGAGGMARREVNCGISGGIPQEARIELSRATRDPLGRWELWGRCIDPRECVPFLVRFPSGSLPREIVSSLKLRIEHELRVGRTKSGPAGFTPLVRAGERLTLDWDQDGIRLITPAVSLDQGGRGDRVRARIAHSGRVVAAIVVSAGKLRAGL